MRSDWIAYEAEQKGIEKGIEQGIETGKEAGNEERKIRTIVNMFKKHKRYHGGLRGNGRRAC